jgi:SH3-like domain-containing protein
MKAWVPFVVTLAPGTYARCATRLVTAVLALAAVSAPAATVTPSDRVVNFLSIRARPTSNSPRVGTLSPGQDAKVVHEMSGWFRVKLADGTEGFVSKSWVVETSTAGLATWARSSIGHPSFGSSNSNPRRTVASSSTRH